MTEFPASDVPAQLLLLYNYVVVEICKMISCYSLASSCPRGSLVLSVWDDAAASGSEISPMLWDVLLRVVLPADDTATGTIFCVLNEAIMGR